MKKFFLLLALFMAGAAPAFAQTTAQTQIARTETYLESLTTIKARFIQTDNQGQQLAGTFYLSRPGKMRFEYDGPVHDSIVADGINVYYYDAAMKQTSSALISRTLAHFFLRPDIQLNGEIMVNDIIRGGGLLQVTITRSKDPQAGSMTLGLKEGAKKSLSLKKWRVTDEQGAITEIELFDPEFGIGLGRELFRYRDPQKSTPRFN